MDCRVNQVQLRVAAVFELAALREIRNQSAQWACRSVYTGEQLAAWLARPLPDKMLRLLESGFVMVAEVQDRVVGYGALDPESQEIEAVFVLPDHAGQGVGLALLRALEAAAQRLGLDQLQLAASLNAVSFYRQAGYTSVSSGEFALNETQSLGFERMKKRITVAV